MLVTGATGLVGAHLVSHLLASGESPRALVRSGADDTALRAVLAINNTLELYDRIEWVEGDLMDVLSLQKAMDGVHHIYHCAALVSFDPRDDKKLLDNNIRGTDNLVNACDPDKIHKFCYCSSVAAIGKNEDESEANTATPWQQHPMLSAYSISKYYAEMEVWRAAAEGLKVVMVNPSIVLGPGKWGQSSTTIIETADKGLRYATSGSNGYVDARDVALSMKLLMDSDISGKRFILNSVNMTNLEMQSRLALALGKKAPDRIISAAGLSFAWRMEKMLALLSGRKRRISRRTAWAAQQNLRFDGSEICNLPCFNFNYRPIEESITYVAQAYLEHCGR